MISVFVRKFDQLVEDATLRRWLYERLLGRTSGAPAFTVHQPPYVTSLDLGSPPKPAPVFTALRTLAPKQSITLDLAGLDVSLDLGDEASLFSQAFDDIEQLLALHRFAWIAPDTDPAWVAAIWLAWIKRFATPDSSWPWHPYTAAERAINLMVFAKRHGLPEPYDESWKVLAAHGQAIASRLEYFGPHYTGNHLANDGRGLFCLGVFLGWKAAADLGGQILLEEAKRLFGASGVLIEGSSHYHLLLAKNYGEAALWARESSRPEADALTEISEKARHAAGGLLLTGGLPLIGDISPDLPPSILVPQFTRTDADLSVDGWHRFEEGDWSLLLYAPPDGWPPMPGHGHQDLGSFELHWRGVPLIVDVGRGQYGEAGDAAAYRKAAAHNGLTFMDYDPRPVNRPYYAPEFRRRIGGAVPSITRSAQRLELCYPMGGTAVCRRFVALGNRFIVEDAVTGSGNKVIERRVVTSNPVEIENKQAIIVTPAGKVRLTEESALLCESITRWNRYGQGQPATVLGISVKIRLPWQGRMTLEAA